MTSHTRKLTVGVALLVIAIVVFLFRNDKPCIAVTFLDYRYDGFLAVLQITNLSRSVFTYQAAWSHANYGDGKTGILDAHQHHQVEMVLVGLPSPVERPRAVIRYWSENLLRDRMRALARRTGFDIPGRWSEVFVDLPTPRQPSP